MNRLIKKAFGKTLYHGTSVNKLRGITQAGMLMPQEEHGGGMVDGKIEDYDGFTFWATTLDTAKYYAMIMPYDGGPRVIIEADISEDALLPDEGDNPDASNWRASVTRNDQAKVLGPVQDNYFRRLYFIDETTKDVVFECNYQGWETEFENHKDEFEFNGSEDSDQFTKKLEDTGITVDSNYIINQPIDKYIEVLNKMYPNAPHEIGCTIINGDIYVKIMGSRLDVGGNLFSYDKGYENGAVVFYDINVDGMYNLNNQNPNTLSNFEKVFGNSIVSIEEDGTYYDLEMEEFVDEVKRYGKRNGLEDNVANIIDKRIFKQAEVGEVEKSEILKAVFKKADPIERFKEMRQQRQALEQEDDLAKEAAVKTMPNNTKFSDFNLALADYLYKELKKMKFKVHKPNDLSIHLAFEKTIEPKYNTIVLDCLDGRVYLRGEEQKDRQIGRLRNFRGTRASDAYHCMKSSIERILRKIEKYHINVVDLRNYYGEDN